MSFKESSPSLFESTPPILQVKVPRVVNKRAPAVTNEATGRKFKKLISELAPEEICPRIECGRAA